MAAEEEEGEFLTPPTTGPCNTAISNDIFNSFDLPELPDDLDKLATAASAEEQSNVVSRNCETSSFIEPEDFGDEEEYVPLEDQTKDDSSSEEDEEEEEEKVVEDNNNNELENVETPVIKTKTLTIRRPSAVKALKTVVNHAKDRLTTVGAPRKKRRNRPGTVALREIRKYQSSTDLLIPKLPISKLIREIAASYHPTGLGYKFTQSAMEAIHSEAEAFLQELFAEAQNHACLSGRIELLKIDLQFAFTNYVKSHNFFYK